MTEIEVKVMIASVPSKEARTELEPLQAAEQLRGLREEMEVLLAVNRAIGRHLERDELFGALAACLRNVFETDRFGIELPIEGERLQGQLLTPSGEKKQPTRVKVLPAQGTACNWVLQNRKWLVSATREELRERFPLTFEVMTNENMESLCAMPLVSDDRARGVLFFMAARKEAYGGLRRGLLEQVTGAVAVALDDCLAHEEVRRLRDQLAAENAYLQEEIQSEHNFQEIVGNSPALLALLKPVDQVAPTNATVLIYGETGTGKELIARAIHDRSERRGRPLVKVNCGAISAGLVESELFGHVKGAFTGAIQRRTGRFELANGGTLFLDEVSELPPETQVKLLRVLQEGEFEPVGSSHTVRVDVRVIAASNIDLAGAVTAGRFRSDLFYRLNVFPLRMPPLRDRGSDICDLAMFFLTRFAKKFGKRIESISEETLSRLAAYSWPGNVRELQNIIERAVILCTGPVLRVDQELLSVAPSANSVGVQAMAATTLPTSYSSAAPSDVPPETAPPMTLEDAERRHILTALKQTKGVIDGPNGAAKILSVHPNTLRSRMKRLGIHRPSHEMA